MTANKLLVYLFRRDLRVSDNPILHHLASTTDHGFTHLLPVFVFPSHQIEVSGLLKDGEKSPYPQALSQVGRYWRCGRHRARFITQSVWDLKGNLEKLNSGLSLQVGQAGDVVKHLVDHFGGGSSEVGAVWMTEEFSHEEIQEQQEVEQICSDRSIQFKLWTDEKYFIHDEDTGLGNSKDLPDVFTTYRKSQEPLRERPRKALSKPDVSQLPSLPNNIPSAYHPFRIPDNLDDCLSCLLKPLEEEAFLSQPPSFPDDATSAHPFGGGESAAHDRLTHLITSGEVSSYKETRNGLLGPGFSTKLSAFLAQGCITARQVHEELARYEDGDATAYSEGSGFGEGENEGTKAIRFELLWRDYMRLCTRKFGRKLFSLYGFRQGERDKKRWKTSDKKMAALTQDPAPETIANYIDRFLNGTTGMGLIDASQRELFNTGYTSNRARQNAASFFSKHLDIDWRYGAEWYEMLLIDYDVSSNWSNWQYVAGVGNDPRGDARIFNPVKQAFDYDKEAKYVRTWVPEVKDLEKPENVFQVCTASADELANHGLTDNVMVTDPLKRIEFTVEPKPRANRRAFPRRRGGFGRGGRRGGGGNGSGGNGGGSSRGGSYTNGGANGSHMNGYNGNGNSGPSDSSFDSPRHGSSYGSRRGRSNGFQSYRANGHHSGMANHNSYSGNPWTNTYHGYTDNYAPSPFAGYNGYSNSPAQWQGGWDSPSRGGYNGYRGAGSGGHQGWETGRGGGYRGSYQVQQAQYMPVPTYMQMPPHIGPSM